jgi:cysteine synthase
MGIPNVIAETGAGQHGVASAMAGANLGLSVKVYQGEVDIQRQKLNVLRMKLFGAQLISVTEGNAKLKEAVNAAMRDWFSKNGENISKNNWRRNEISNHPKNRKTSLCLICMCRRREQCSGNVYSFC